MKPDYCIYPTLLDSFFWYKKYPERFEDLINKINRVKHPQPISALKGVQFEDVVNWVIAGKPVDGNEKEYITANFRFSHDIVHKVAKKLQNARKQQEYIEAIVPTSMGNVKIYGFVDYSFPEMDCDLKTGAMYKIGKYRYYNQHKAYSLIRQLNGNPIKQFNYVVTDFQRMFIESYDCTEKLHNEVIEELEDFILFINHYKHLITDNKIFGL